MTRKLLLEKICLSDCTYNCVILDTCDCDYCNVKLNELLDEYDKQIRADAIDEFVKKIKESNQGHWRPTRYEHGEVVSETMSYDIGTIRLIAEQLKAGDKDE